MTTSQSKPCFASIAVLAVAATCLGCEISGDAGQQTAVYICTETQEAFVGPPQPVPLSHPDTGRPTLVQGLYNPKLELWQPAPPLEVLGGNPGAIVDREDDQPLTPVGPTDGLRHLPHME